MVVSDYIEWKFGPQYHDWLTGTELTLTVYNPRAELINLLEWNIGKWNKFSTARYFNGFLLCNNIDLKNQFCAVIYLNFEVASKLL
jgi:hypothetical protein